MFRKIFVLLAAAPLIALAGCKDDSTEGNKNAQEGTESEAIEITQENASQLVQWKILSGFGNLTFSADGTRLASEGPGDDVLLWDIPGGEIVQTFADHTSFVNTVALSGDGKWVASTQDNTILLRDIATSQTAHILEGHTDQVYRMLFSPDAMHLASSSRDATVRLWDLDTGQEQYALESQASLIGFTPDGKQVITRGSDSTVAAWDVAGGEQISTLTLDEDITPPLVLSPDGKTLASSDQQGMMQLWDMATGKSQLKNPVAVCSVEVTSINFNPAGSLLAVGCTSGDVHVWDAALTTEKITLLAHGGYVASLAFSPDGSLLATSGGDNVSWLWHIAEKPATVQPRPGHWSSVGIEHPDFLSYETKVSFTVQPDGTITDLEMRVPFGMMENSCKLTFAKITPAPDGTFELPAVNEDPIEGQFISETLVAGFTPSTMFCETSVRSVPGQPAWNAIWISE